MDMIPSTTNDPKDKGRRLLLNKVAQETPSPIEEELAIAEGVEAGPVEGAINVDADFNREQSLWNQAKKIESDEVAQEAPSRPVPTAKPKEDSTDWGALAAMAAPLLVGAIEGDVGAGAEATSRGMLHMMKHNDKQREIASKPKRMSFEEYSKRRQMTIDASKKAANTKYMRNSSKEFAKETKGYRDTAHSLEIALDNLGRGVLPDKAALQLLSKSLEGGRMTDADRNYYKSEFSGLYEIAEKAKETKDNVMRDRLINEVRGMLQRSINKTNEFMGNRKDEYVRRVGLSFPDLDKSEIANMIYHDGFSSEEAESNIIRKDGIDYKKVKGGWVPYEK